MPGRGVDQSVPHQRRTFRPSGDGCKRGARVSQHLAAVGAALAVAVKVDPAVRAPEAVAPRRGAGISAPKDRLPLTCRTSPPCDSTRMISDSARSSDLRSARWSVGPSAWHDAAASMPTVAPCSGGINRHLRGRRPSCRIPRIGGEALSTTATGRSARAALSLGIPLKKQIYKNRYYLLPVADPRRSSTSLPSRASMCSSTKPPTSTEQTGCSRLLVNALARRFSEHALW